MKILLIIAGCIVFVIGCGPPRQTSRPVTDECAPTNLMVQSNDSTLYLKWDTNCPEEKAMSGYSIYIEESPIYEKYGKMSLPKKIERFNRLLYPGDTDPENRFETMTINNLTNVVEYYVSIRTVFPDKGRGSMERGGIFGGRLEAVSLLGHYVQEHWPLELPGHGQVFL